MTRIVVNERVTELAEEERRPAPERAPDLTSSARLASIHAGAANFLRCAEPRAGGRPGSRRWRIADGLFLGCLGGQWWLSIFTAMPDIDRAAAREILKAVMRRRVKP